MSRAADLFPFDGLKPISSLQFASTATAVLPGKGHGAPAESLGSVGIALRFEQNNYWDSDVYSAHSFTVSQGTLSDDQGRIGTALPSYKVSKPTYSADYQFSASSSDLFYIFPTKEDYVVYSLLDSASTPPAGKKMVRFGNYALIEEARVAAQSITTGAFLKIPNVRLNDLTRDTVFVFAPASRALNATTSVGTDVTAAVIAQTAYGPVARFSYDVSGLGTLAGTGSDDAAGPAPVYGQNPRFPLMTSDSRVDVGFQDASTGNIKVLKVSSGNQTSALAMPLSLAHLGAMTKDTSNNYFYLTAADGTNPQVSLVKTNAAGQQLYKTDLGNADNQFDILRWDFPTASISVNGNSVCTLFSRIIQSGHQGSIAAIFNSNDLSLQQNLGQNSGHSFENRIINDGSAFVSLDLGDNYPRGIIIHRMTTTGKDGRVIFTYKTALSTTPKDDLPAGKWSNDNRTYTELGDVFATSGGYLALFASEKHVDNALATSELNESRNIGLVTVKSSFPTASQTDYIVNHDIVSSTGEDSPDFSFYDFGGAQRRQKNVGVVWLTSYTDKTTETAARPKVVDLGDGRFIVLWELWSNVAYRSTFAQIFDSQGQLLSPVISLGSSVRLARGENIKRIGNYLVWPTASTNQLELNVWHFQSDGGSGAAPEGSISDATITEGNSGNKNMAFTVTLSKAHTSTVTVSYATANGSNNPALSGTDYVATSGMLTFAAGELTKTINVPIKGDTIAEPNEEFFVNLSAPTNMTLTDAQGVGTITDDDDHAPVVVSVTPKTGTGYVGTPGTLSAIYSDRDGNADISQARILLNTSATTTNSLAGLYDAVADRLYLYANDGVTLTGGFAPGSNNVISNSQGSLNCAATTVTRSGNNLTVKWSLTPGKTFIGLKNVYLYCHDSSGAADGFDDLGDWTIKSASNSAPVNVRVTPNALTSTPGSAKSLTAVYTDADGALDIKLAYILVHNTTGGTTALYATYDAVANKLYLRNDANTIALGGFAPGSNNVISNSQGSLNCAATTVTRSGNNLTVKWVFTPSNRFTGTKNVYLYCRDSSGAADGFDDLGNWAIGSADSRPSTQPSGASG